MCEGNNRGPRVKVSGAAFLIRGLQVQFLPRLPINSLTPFVASGASRFYLEFLCPLQICEGHGNRD